MKIDYFNPRPPRGGRRRTLKLTGTEYIDFNPRPPRGGRLCAELVLRLVADFNPRPPRGGRRSADVPQNAYYVNFNPRPPRGGRHLSAHRVVAHSRFQSTPSAGRATSGRSAENMVGEFQSTPSAGRATPLQCSLSEVHMKFQSTPSAGRATAKMHKFCLQFSFNLQISLKPTHFKSIIKYFYAHFCKKHDMFPVRKPAGIDVSMNFALKH